MHIQIRLMTSRQENQDQSKGVQQHRMNRAIGMRDRHRMIQSHHKSNTES